MDTASEHLKKVRLLLFITDALMYSGDSQDTVQFFTSSIQSFIEVYREVTKGQKAWLTPDLGVFMIVIFSFLFACLANPKPRYPCDQFDLPFSLPINCIWLLNWLNERRLYKNYEIYNTCLTDVKYCCIVIATFNKFHQSFFRWFFQRATLTKLQI